MSTISSTPLRAGDWICTLCNNLNFSFRNECNRCQQQTKTQNFVQNLLSLSKEIPFQQTQNQQQGATAQFSSKLEGGSKRQPLGDISKRILNENREHSPSNEQGSTAKKSDSSISKEKGANGALTFPDEKIESGSGFKKALLLTPPRSIPLISAEDSLVTPLPYKSPYKLPSISQFLQNLMLSSSGASSRNLSSNKTCKKSKCVVENSGSNSCQKTLKIKKKKINEGPKKSFSVLDKRGDPCSNHFVPSNLDNILGEQKVLLGETHHDAEKMIQSCINKIFEGEEEVCRDLNKSGRINGRNKGNSVGGGKQMEKTGEGGAPVKERKKDWLCSYCGNLNYSFRVCCNRCQASK